MKQLPTPEYIEKRSAYLMDDEGKFISICKDSIRVYPDCFSCSLWMDSFEDGVDFIMACVVVNLNMMTFRFSNVKLFVTGRKEFSDYAAADDSVWFEVSDDNIGGLLIRDYWDCDGMIQ